MRVLLACRDPRRRRALVTAAHGVADVVDAVDDVDGGVDPSRYQALVVDDDGVEREAPLAGIDTGATPVVALLHTQREARLLPWLESARAAHVIQYEGALRYDDLHVTLRKIATGDIFGDDKYLAWGARRQSYTLRASEERGALFEALEDFAAERGTPRRMRALAATVLDEFVSNALYNAPVEPDGTRRFRDLERATPVALRGDERVSVSLASDGRRLSVSVSDPFGSLTWETLRTSLVRGLRRGTQRWEHSRGGAGIGFYCALEALSHLVVNVEPGRRTELVGILSLHDTYREFLVAGKSFDMFTAPGSSEGSGA